MYMGKCRVILEYGVAQSGRLTFVAANLSLLFIVRTYWLTYVERALECVIL